ncbi:MAG: hypothetical protein N2201_03230 [candidate division WOR-3 bacterium]|nr:hypothetical protein [candidate division WOR-3 bacterium]
MTISTNPWIWVSAILTLGIFSFLYKENPFYRVCEHLFVGISNGYSITFVWHRVLMPTLINPVARGERLWLILIAIVGALYFTRFIPRVSWLVRIPIAIVMGYGAGASIPRGIDAGIIEQIRATIVTRNSFSIITNGIWALVILFGVIATVSYFFFSRERKGILKPLSYSGIIFIMLGFGASFGYTVMARISLLIGRLTFLLRDWLGIIH